MPNPWQAGMSGGDWRTWVLVWVVDPVTGKRHMATKLLVDVLPGEERVKL